uniref:Stage II sporulation protein M n=1 Tax=Ascaris lumbricoides TaxID=6252 RepID=A0A0M3IWL6_ASCLU
MIAFRIVLLLLALSVIVASFSMVLVEERISYSKHLQTISGVKPWLYWIVNFVHDMIFFTIPSLAFIMIGIGLFFVGTVFTMVVMLLENLMQQDDTLVTAYVVCGIVFMILPQYNLGMAMYRMNFVYMLYGQGTTYLGGQTLL